jgi:hypothetical protein
LPSVSEVGHAGLAEVAPAVLEEVVPTVSEIRLSFKQARIEDRNEGSTADPVVTALDGDGNEEAEQEEEVWSTPQMPHNGMSFASLDKAKEYYNSYAKRTGFLIRTNTSYRSAKTREIQKVQFVCYKEGFGRKRRAAQFADAVTCYSDNDKAEEEDTANKEEDGQGEKRKKLDGCKKRKREK